MFLAKNIAKNIAKSCIANLPQRWNPDSGGRQDSMKHRAPSLLERGIRLPLGGYELHLQLRGRPKADTKKAPKKEPKAAPKAAPKKVLEKQFDPSRHQAPFRMHIGPGQHWQKPTAHWIAVDVDPERGDLVIDFNDFTRFPLPDASVVAIYGSHVFEHMSVYATPLVFRECRRILQPGGVLRLILPDAEKSLREYVAGNASFSLFARRRARALQRYGIEYTLFECMREDFLSRSGQKVLGKEALAHQNAWDFETIVADLTRAGFSRVERSAFQGSSNDEFRFEGTYPSEANESDRSLYVEAS